MQGIYNYIPEKNHVCRVCLYGFNCSVFTSNVISQVEIKCQLDETDVFFITDLIACLACLGHHYAHHQELMSIIQVVAACGIWCFGFRVIGML